MDEHKFDATNTEFQSSEPGQVIKSARKFGLEIEMFNKSTEAIKELHHSISNAFGFDRDGSINAPGSVGIEIVSPIISGSLGENVIRDLFNRIRKLKFGINVSCGLHVHLDGQGFKRDDKMSVLSREELSQDTLNTLTRKDYIFVVRNKLLKEIESLVECQRPEFIRTMMDEYLSTGRKTLHLSKIVGRTVPVVKVRSTELSLGKSNLIVDYYDFANLIEAPTKSETIKMKSFDLKPKDVIVIIKQDDSLEHIKTLLYFHTVFSDIFMAMLPKSRRCNAYCQNLSIAFSPTQIEAIQSHTELETMWYKAGNLIDVTSHKNNHYDDSRYYGINLHSLFAKYGTVEMRAHSATLEPNKALYWVALHQDILDKVVAGKITIETMKIGLHLDSIDDKLTFFLDVLKPRTSIRKYVCQRIQWFNNNIK